MTAVIDLEDRPADVTLDGPPEAILGLGAGVLDPRDHIGGGFRGGRAATRRFRTWTSRAAAIA